MDDDDIGLIDKMFDGKARPLDIGALNRDSKKRRVPAMPSLRGVKGSLGPEQVRRVWLSTLIAASASAAIFWVGLSGPVWQQWVLMAAVSTAVIVTGIRHEVSTALFLAAAPVLVVLASRYPLGWPLLVLAVGVYIAAQLRD